MKIVEPRGQEFARCVFPFAASVSRTISEEFLSFPMPAGLSLNPQLGSPPAQVRNSATSGTPVHAFMGMFPKGRITEPIPPLNPCCQLAHCLVVRRNNYHNFLLVRLVGPRFFYLVPGSLSATVQRPFSCLSGSPASLHVPRWDGRQEAQEQEGRAGGREPTQ